MLASSSHRSRAGVTLVEALIAIAILGILIGALSPVVSRQITHSRVNNAARTVAADLESALSLAGRQRRPVRVTVDPGQRSVVIADRASGQVIVQHAYGALSEYKLETLSGAPAVVDILPQGMATSATTVTIGIDSYSRLVTLTRAGVVRVQP